MPYRMASDKRRDKQGYWEARLTRMGLSAEAGRHNWLVYGHIATELDYDGRKTFTAAQSREDSESNCHGPEVRSR